MRKKLKISTFIIAVILCVVALSSCTGSVTEAQTEFDKIMSAFKSGDIKQIDEAYGFTEIAGFVDKTSGENLRNAVISTLTKMDYKVNSAERINSAAVRFKVGITTVDFSKIVDVYIDKLTTLTSSREYKYKLDAMTDEEYEALMTDNMIDAIEEAGEEKVSKEIEVTMTKRDDKWSLGGDSDAFLEALFAGLSLAVNSLI